MVNSQAKGKAAERRVARYLTEAGLPARRHVRTGTVDVHDEGDIRLDCAPVTIEIKDYGVSNPITIGAARTLLTKLQRQKRPGDLGLLVVKANGHADPAVWHCYTDVADASLLLAPGLKAVGLPGWQPVGDMAWPVRFQFDMVVAMLWAGGWVTAAQPSEANPFMPTPVNPFR